MAARAIWSTKEEAWPPGHGAKGGGTETLGFPWLCCRLSLTEGHCSRHPFVVLSQAPGGWKLGRHRLPRDKSFYELPGLAERGTQPAGPGDGPPLLPGPSCGSEALPGSKRGWGGGTDTLGGGPAEMPGCPAGRRQVRGESLCSSCSGRPRRPSKQVP